MSRKTNQTPAAAYTRMSGRSQYKSPAEQRGEIAKLATREGYRIVEWFADEAVTGDSTTAAPRVQALLEGAKAGKFATVLGVAYQPDYPRRFDERERLL